MREVPPDGPPPSWYRNYWWGLLLLALAAVALIILIVWLANRNTSDNKTTVPDVVGLQQAEAVGRVEAQHLQAAIVVRKASAPAGQVVAETPGAGSQLTKGQTVVLDVAGPAQTTTTTTTTHGADDCHDHDRHEDGDRRRDDDADGDAADDDHGAADPAEDRDDAGRAGPELHAGRPGSRGARAAPADLSGRLDRATGNRRCPEPARRQRGAQRRARPAQRLARAGHTLVGPDPEPRRAQGDAGARQMRAGEVHLPHRLPRSDVAELIRQGRDSEAGSGNDRARADADHARRAAKT